MWSHSIVRSPVAIAVGCIFTLVTTWVLLEDFVRYGAPFTTKHVMTVATLGGTVYFGHRLWDEFTSWRLGNALGCAVLFFGGTIFCVLSSAGRNAEAVTNKVAVANAVNTGRELAARDFTEAHTRYNVALAAETKECATGEGALCKAARINSMVRRGQYDDAKSKFAQERPEQVANADIRAAAALLSNLPWVSADVTKLEATLLLAFPFLQALFCEIAAIVAFAIGIGHRAVAAPIRASLALLPPPESKSQKLEIVRKARTSDEQHVLDALDKAGRPLSCEELAEAMSVSPSESTKRRQVCEASGVVKTKRVGKYLMVSPAVA